ncbi:conserved hypothetical protein [Neospora caninum Liverpool]|uniref:DnaJ domain-containing protein n=1 Tax=Neospora caninum (strain Liverpool) TaxID=572307 RepID=F0VKX9_NEOCL|nr:conserved hypothetical protein [Neospora caninum Liverpool]CBZ54731.1 conserved hypothetical protein [Neospora caninum Liverpool]CEL69446.1 TPA: DnaJ domain-containing protein [Neospora caninum Liverpool]|eukprot:XP_003884759.1 conserved hypothetical protein [Neospora caninum Liverpool]
MNRYGAFAAVSRVTGASHCRRSRRERALWGGYGEHPSTCTPRSGGLECFSSSAFSEKRWRNLKASHLESHPPSWPREAPPPDPFELLGVKTKHPTAKELRLAYFRLVKKLHPDLAAGEQQTRRPSRGTAAGRKFLPGPFLSFSSSPSLTIDDARWAYEAAVVALQAPQWNRDEPWSGGASEDQPVDGGREQKASGGHERQRTVRLHQWRLRQSEAAAFWHEHHSEKDATDATGWSEEGTLFHRLFHRRLRQESSSSRQEGDPLQLSGVLEASQGRQPSQPQASQWSDDDFAHLQRQELEELGLSTRVVEELGLVRTEPAGDTPYSSPSEIRHAVAATDASPLEARGHRREKETRTQERLFRSDCQVLFRAAAGACLVAFLCFSVLAAGPT